MNNTSDTSINLCIYENLIWNNENNIRIKISYLVIFWMLVSSFALMYALIIVNVLKRHFSSEKCKAITAFILISLYIFLFTATIYICIQVIYTIFNLLLVYLYCVGPFSLKNTWIIITIVLFVSIPILVINTGIIITPIILYWREMIIGIRDNLQEPLNNVEVRN